ncbi:MAG: hypothetical protein JWO94_553 [Verrucomicrobiaceae bacterium]|nr:hypothetical protein [Verrucomicrobiaceae bacterium]
MAVATALPLVSTLAWSEPHIAITRAALAVLPAGQQDLLGAERGPLGEDYCLIPDHVYSDKDNRKFAMMDSLPGEVYIKKLHLPVDQPEDLETLRYFMAKAVEALKAGKTGDAARYMGTLCHTIEDYGSPSHTMPGDNMFTLLQQFLPPPEAMKDQLLHSPIESGEITVVITGYKPRLLGTTVDEASWRLLHRVHEGIINARSTTIPIIQALYADDRDAVVKGQLKAASLDAQVVADAFHTILCLGTQKLEPSEQVPLKNVAIGGFFPLEAVNLFYAQTQFSSSPNWGHARSGVILEGGKKAVPLKLKVDEKSGLIVEEFTNGISVIMGRPLTFLLPRGVYHRFTALAGLHPELGAKGRVEFTLLGDGKPLAAATVNGTDPAHEFDCDISQVTQLQLAAAHKGLDAKSDYAIWAEPMLIKRP